MSFIQFQSLIADTAQRLGYDAALLASQASAESDFNPEARSSVGALGLMQFMPATWQEWGEGDATDPAASLTAGVRYMQHLLARYANTASPTELALASYNWGMGHVDKLIQATQRTDWDFLKDHAPKETQDYVQRIMGRLPIYRAALGVAAPVALGGLVLIGIFFGVFFLLKRLGVL